MTRLMTTMPKRMVLSSKGEKRAKVKARKVKATKTRKKGKGKGKDNAKATEYFAEYFSAKDCWFAESSKSGKVTTSMETPITPAANTTTEPPITGMLIQSDDGGAVPADLTQWLHSVTKREPSHSDLPIDSGASTSVC